MRTCRSPSSDWRGLSAIAAGVVLTAATVSWTAGSWIQARNAEPWPSRPVRAGRVRRHGRRPAAFSAILAPTCPSPWRCPPSRVAGLGMGLGYAPLSLIVLREAPPETQGAASSALQPVRHPRDRARDGRLAGRSSRPASRSTGDAESAAWSAPSRWRSRSGIGGVLLTRACAGPSPVDASHRRSATPASHPS